MAYKKTKRSRYVGSRVFTAMVESGHSPKTLAESIGVTRSTIYRIVHGQGDVKAETLWLVAMECGVGIGFFYEGAPEWSR